jgi:signal transduction histidine kinase
MIFATPQPWAALVAFAALGANLLGTALLILLNPRSRAVRWHAGFMFWIMAWLALQGWFTLGLGNATLFQLYVFVVHMMPAFFLAAALVETRQMGDFPALLVVAAAAPFAPFLNPMTAGALGTAWHAALWGSAAWLHYRDRSNRSRSGYAGSDRLFRSPRGALRSETDAVQGGELALKVVLLVVVPVCVVAIIVLGGRFLLYAMPLITIGIQFLIFIGVVHHRFYDIEVRAARSGELASRAAEQERLALLGELAATLAHEIRNPLTGMRSLAQRLAGAQLDDDRRQRYASVILGEVDRLERVAGNLLDVGRRSVVRDTPLEATALDPLFDDLMLLMDSRARRAEVLLERDGGGLRAAAPRDALAQSLLNLLINAIAHTPPGGRVRLSAAATDGEHIQVRVIDSGPGVPAEEREEIFEPFHTRGVGAGLGLAVVRRIARELSWDIDVGEAPGGGAAFHLRIPAAS